MLSLHAKISRKEQAGGTPVRMRGAVVERGSEREYGELSMIRGRFFSGRMRKSPHRHVRNRHVRAKLFVFKRSDDYASERFLQADFSSSSARADEEASARSSASNRLKLRLSVMASASEVSGMERASAFEVPVATAETL